MTGFVAECLVQAYAILGAGGRLVGFLPGTDIDHKDLIVDQVGGFLNAYIQVKCATQLHGTHLRCIAHYFPKAVPSHSHFAYVFCYLDVRAMDLPRIWVVPSTDFNRLAERSRASGGKVALIFSAKVAGDPQWDKYLVDKQSLGPRLLKLTRTPTKRKALSHLDLGSVLVLRASATPSR